MKRLTHAWLVALIAVMVFGWWHGGAGSVAQSNQTTQGSAQLTDAEDLLTQVADAQRGEDALMAELAAAHATEIAAAAATVTALEAQNTALSVNNAAQATEIAALQTQVAELSATDSGNAGQPPAITVGVNQEANAGAWSFMVTGLGRQESITGDDETDETVDAQGVFLLVQIALLNNGTEAQQYDPSWFRVTDDRGRSWPFDFWMTDTLALDGAGVRQYESVQPGLPGEAVIVFDVPPDATGLVLQTVTDLDATSQPAPNPFVIQLGE